MTSDSWPGVAPRLGRGAFAAGFIALGCITPSVPTAFGASGGSIEFQGELNYEAFKRASAKGVAIRITNSPGGTGAAAMVLGRAKGLVIDGRCQSACAWAFVQNQSACFTSRASFDFHAAHDPGTGRRLTAATDYWLSTVGPELRSRLSSLRTSSSLVRISAKEMARYYGGRACGASGARTEIAAAKPRSTDAATEKLATRPAPAPAATEVAAADASGSTPWSKADTNAGLDAMRTMESSGGVIVASLIASAQSEMTETPEQPETANSLIGRLMPSLSAGNPEQLSSTWPEAAYALWEGIVISAAPSAAELAARSDGTSEG